VFVNSKVNVTNQAFRCRRFFLAKALSFLKLVPPLESGLIFHCLGDFATSAVPLWTGHETINYSLHVSIHCLQINDERISSG
jgi:hypothetical protein